ncbi:hypothetical protein BC941DRAFT_454788 [Chlamydoabsidia padenii]|nr:hypothetical protein BC941DRAFT_454788 [Chlamydoabsidia padenii]
MLQSFNTPSPDSSILYPSLESDQYVRSHPVHGGTNSAMSSMDYETISPSHLYGNTDMNMNMYEQHLFQQPHQQQQLHHQQYIPSHQQQQQQYQGSLGTTGLRHSYQVTPDISLSPYFMPNIQSTMAFQSANISRKADNNPSCGETDKEQQQDTFVPSKEEKKDTHEDKKNLATMVNVFASRTDDNTTSDYKASSTKNNDSTGIEKEETTTTADDKLPTNIDIMNLLTSDMSALNVDEDNDYSVTALSKDENSIKPPLPSRSTKQTLLPENNQYRTSSLEQQQQHQHQQLISRISQWVNSNYNKKKQANKPTQQQQQHSTTLHVA